MGIAAKVIREYRAKLRLSQKELAKRLGVERKTILRWENGQTNPGYDDVLKVQRLVEKKGDAA